jgi:hypothetical protein
MAKAIRRESARRRRVSDQGSLPLGKENLVVIGIGLVIIAAGYLALLEGSVEGFLPLVLAPILLVLGYCVVIPLGILYKRKKGKKEQAKKEEQS